MDNFFALKRGQATALVESLAGTMLVDIADGGANDFLGGG